VTTEWDTALSWLHKQLDAEERLARESEGAWIPLGPSPDDSRPIARLMTRNAPAAILRRVESDRRILALYDAARVNASRDAESEGRFYLTGDVVRAFAQRYAHLPDFPEVLRLEGTTAP
jgi:hypothetical protein